MRPENPREGFPRREGTRYATKRIEGAWPKPEAEGAQTNKAPTITIHYEDTTHAEDPINYLLKHGLTDGLPEIAEMLMNAAMLIERSVHLKAGRYERSEDRNGYANGLKERSFHRSVGPLALRVPQT